MRGFIYTPLSYHIHPQKTRAKWVIFQPKSLPHFCTLSTKKTSFPPVLYFIFHFYYHCSFCLTNSLIRDIIYIRYVLRGLDIKNYILRNYDFPAKKALAYIIERLLTSGGAQHEKTYASFFCYHDRCRHYVQQRPSFCGC